MKVIEYANTTDTGKVIYNQYIGPDTPILGSGGNRCSARIRLRGEQGRARRRLKKAARRAGVPLKSYTSSR